MGMGDKRGSNVTVGEPGANEKPRTKIRGDWRSPQGGLGRLEARHRSAWDRIAHHVRGTKYVSVHIEEVRCLHIVIQVLLLHAQVTGVDTRPAIGQHCSDAAGVVSRLSNRKLSSFIEGPDRAWKGHRRADAIISAIEYTMPRV
jgi:hypothetical protein